MLWTDRACMQEKLSINEPGSLGALLDGVHVRLGDIL